MSKLVTDPGTCDTVSLATAEAPTSRVETLTVVPDMPATIGRFVVLERLGAGGMGVVFAAYDPELDRKVAIKLIYAAADGSRQHRRQDLLLREAQALARLAHPNIVAIHDVGVHEGQVFVAMEFVAGRTMRQWWEDRGPGWQEVLAAMVQAGRGIVAAHAAGLIHRDIKPDNLLIGDDGRVRVADFGIARFDASAVEPSTLISGVRELATVAGRGSVIGTPAYMPPEQHDSADVGPHSDQFSFCVTLWEGLYGRRPFVGETHRLPELIRAGAPEKPAGAPELPGWLEQAVRRGLSPRPADRWPSMQALLDVLAFDFDARRARWRWRVLYAALAVVGCVALVLGGRALQASWARQAAERAAAERLVGVGASVARMLAKGAREQAEETLRAFVAEPELRDSRAAIDAWLMWADHMDALGDRAAAQAAVVEAYMALPEDDPREPAIALRIARQFRAQWKFHELAALGEQAVQRWPALVRAPEWAHLRAEAALARGDLAGFLAAVDVGLADRELMDVAPALRSLTTARCPVREDRVAMLTEVTGDGRPELLLVNRHGAPRPSLHAMDAALTSLGGRLAELPLGEYWVNDRPLVRAPGGPAYLVGYEGEPVKEVVLYELGEAGPREVLRWPDDVPASSAAADLDGDGLREFYVGTATYTRKLHRLEPDAQGVWRRRPAHAATDAIGSDINGLAVGDFDGDGREELAASVAAWRAYDVRIFEAGPDGELQVGARRRVGHARAVAAVRAADGSTLLALAKDDTARSKDAWPADKPQGEAAGLHIMRRVGDGLVPVAYFPWAMPDGWPQQPKSNRILVGDFDGDGLQDVAAQYDMGSPFAQMLLLRQRPDGSFAGARVGATLPLAAGGFDGDRADELLVAIPRGESTELCVLGVDGEPLAPIVAPRVTAAAPALADPLLARVWARAENLASFGLYHDAAHALESRVTLTANERDRRALRRRAAELYEAAGAFARAGERFEALAAEGDAAAALAAVANFEQGLRMVDALRVVRAALGSAGLTAVQASALRAANERLTAVVDRQARVELMFDRPLDPAWRIDEPLALRSDLVRDELVVDVTADRDAIATLPIELTGEPLTVELELAAERLEWGSRVGVAVRVPGGGEVVLVSVSAGGGGGYLQRNGLSGPQWRAFGLWETASPAERSVHRSRVTLLPGHGRVHIEETGDHPDEAGVQWSGTLERGRAELAIVSTGMPVFESQQARVRIRRIAVTGARLAVGDGDEPAGSTVARELVAGRWHAALAAADEATAQGRLWRGVALAELGRGAEAIAAFASLDPDEPALRRQLKHLLRTRATTFAPVLRAALGARYPALLLEALQKKGEYPDDELWALRLAVTADLEAMTFAAATEATTKAQLRAIRGTAWSTIGELAQAEADLAAAAAALEPWLAGRGETRDAGLATIELRRAEVAADRGITELAFAAAGRALARATDPEWMAERLRISRSLARLQADPRWQELLAGYP